MEKIKKNICYLCGKPIENEDYSEDHLPPRQFFPKNIRKQQNLNLLKVSTHKNCNESYKLDEEYFYVALYPVAKEYGSKMAFDIFTDLKRRAKQPQTKILARSLLGKFSNYTQGGICLPKGKYEYNIDEYRVQRVVLKIVQELFFYHNQQPLPFDKIKDYRMCLGEEEVPEVYRLSWRGAPLTYECEQVFSYKYFSCDNIYCWTLLFWEAIMFNIMVES